MKSEKGMKGEIPDELGYRVGQAPPYVTQDKRATCPSPLQAPAMTEHGPP
jgi:hypothetical protein